MLIRFFRSSFFAQYFALSVLALLLWLPGFLHPQAFVNSDPLTPFSALVSQMVVGFPLAGVVVAFILVVAQAIFFNAIIAANLLSLRVSTIGAFVYLLLMSQSYYQLAPYPFLLSAIFVLAALHTILLLTGSDDPTYYLFNAGLFLGIGSLFYFPVAILMVWLWASLSVSRMKYAREFLITIVGFATAYFFLASWYYLTDQLEWRWEAYGQIPERISLNFSISSGLEWVGMGAVLLLLLLSLPFIYGKAVDKNVSQRKKFTITTWLFFLALASSVFDPESGLLNGLLLIPASIFISYYFSFAKRLLLPQIILLVLILAIIVNNYLRF